MATLPIIIAPDPRLKMKCKPVGQVDEAIATLMTDMLETMYLAPGIGLAAPQVGVTKRVIVVDATGKDEERNPIKMANPELLFTSEEIWTYEEGCLSLPDHYAEVARPTKVRVGYLDENNKRCELEADELLATCIQHEMDHLDGMLFVDHISALKRNMILRKLVKTKKLKAQDAAAE
ncbi:MAG: peptide deformylase [Alphaproteobacteria bacterium]|nr:peptide deformylase [Alphaproteobacteria bacterium]